jgi:hypothetical protein
MGSLVIVPTSETCPLIGFSLTQAPPLSGPLTDPVSLAQNSSGHGNTPRRADSELDLAVCVRQEIRLPKGMLLRSLSPPDQGQKITFLLNKDVDNGIPRACVEMAEIRHFSPGMSRESRRILAFSERRAPDAKRPADRLAGGPVSSFRTG